ncbi:hypothetical protein D1007_38832 [Hordeum vulgare]|nr:hypothetical protein D1007_38832 [Hordeum vulgare]
MKANTSRRYGYTNELEKHTFCCNKSGKPKFNDDAYTPVCEKLSSDIDDPGDGQDDGGKKAGCSSYKSPSGLVKKRRSEFIKQTNCAAKMSVKLTGNKWVVIGVAPDHNHKLIDKPSLTKNLELDKEFNEVIDLGMSPKEFETRWAAMVDTHGIAGDKRFDDLYIINHLWVPCYFRNCFFPFFQSNQQSEGFNAILIRAALCRSYGRALETELNQLYKSRKKKKKKKTAAQAQPPASSSPTKASVGESRATPLCNPPKSSTKGRKRDKRYYSGIELHPKKKTKCEYCKEFGHNCATFTPGLIRSA